MEFKEDHLQILRKIQKKPESSQRELAGELGDLLRALFLQLPACNKFWLKSGNIFVVASDLEI